MLTSAEIRARRAVENLNQRDFAEKLRISREKLIKIEREDIEPDEVVEAHYDALYGKQRLINITFERGADCPKCGGAGSRIWRDERNPERDVYECADCDCVYRAREAWGISNKE